MFQVVLPPDPRSVGIARWLITEWCAPWVAAAHLTEDTVEAALLLASEVVTNAVIHGDGMVQVSLRRVNGASLRVEVSDDGGGMPLIGAQRADAESGRGGQVGGAVGVGAALGLSDEGYGSGGVIAQLA